MAGQNVSCTLIRSCSFLLYHEESKPFLVYADRIATRGHDVHADSRYGPEKCHFSFLRSRSFTLLQFCIQCTVWPGRRNGSGFSPKEQNPGGCPLPCDDSPWPHPIFCGMFGSKTYPPSSAAVPSWRVGRVFGWAGSVLPGQNTFAWPLHVSWQELAASAAGSLACCHFRQHSSGERSCKSSTSLSCPVDRDKKQHTSALLLSALASCIGICVK